MAHDPLSLYRSYLEEGSIRADPIQELAAEKLNSLHHALTRYTPSADRATWRSRFGLSLFSDDVEEGIQAPEGLYLYGQVGRGKSMLMDVFVQTAPVVAKKRVHFHEFLRDFHRELHEWRSSKTKKDIDPIQARVRRLMEESWLLCLDELEVRDIADAMIVGRIFEALFQAGAIVVITSNRAPDDLYKDGLQREKFLPCISLLRQHLDILELTSPTDYRLGRVKGAQVFYAPLGAESDAALTDAFQRLAGGLAPQPASLTVNGRTFTIPQAAGDMARCSFADLCGVPLAAADYLALATQYDSLVLDRVPLLGPHNRNEARRFVMLIDALYEHRTLLILSAAADPHHLYPEGDGAFEFQRTVSRLIEMQSESYIGARHI